MLHEIADLDTYLERYGPVLGQQAVRALAPLHVPGRDGVPDLGLLRPPFEAQAHCVEAVVKAWRREKSVMFVGEMGVGKTLAGMAAVHAHAAGQPYRALVFCPGQLVNKWEREMRETIPGAQVFQLADWRAVKSLDGRSQPAGPEWYVIARDRAKLGAKWRGAYLRDRRGLVRCPSCGGVLVEEDGITVPAERLDKNRAACTWVVGEGGRAPGCGGQLWQMTGELQRYEPALYVKRRLRHFFNYLILDEVHEEKGQHTAQGNAAGALAASCRKVLALTGTLIGGYAEHLRPLLFRLGPKSLVEEGFRWGNSLPFSERYGRIETKITEKSGRGSGFDNRQSRGNTRTKQKYVRPGIMPPLFGRHLLDKTVFLSLSEVADNLPPFAEECVPVAMDAETADEYQDMEKNLKDAVRQMVAAGDRRLLGAMLQALLAYPDHPYGWGPIGYWDKGAFVTVHIPTNLSPGVIRPKEQALIDRCLREREEGRQVWVFVQYTDKHDVQTHLENLLAGAGLKVGSLRASVSLAKREEWINKKAPGLNVVVSHPKLVETGLDLFDKGGRHNFPTLEFYETGYNLFTLRQAARRAYRIGQTMPCRVRYSYYAGTMQERAMLLMGRKLAAAHAVEGKFSTDGLLALTGSDDGPVELALAKCLSERLRGVDVLRTWSKVGASNGAATLPTIPGPPPAAEAPPPEPAPIPAEAPAKPRRRQRDHSLPLFESIGY